jgi:hypothetical protein
MSVPHPSIHDLSHHSPLFDLASSPKWIESFSVAQGILQERLLANISEHILMKRIRAIIMPHVTE